MKKSPKKARPKKAAPKPRVRKRPDPKIAAVFIGPTVANLADRIAKLEAGRADRTAPVTEGPRAGNAINLSAVAGDNRGAAGGICDRLSNLVHRLGLPQDPSPVGADSAQSRDSLLQTLVETGHMIKACHKFLDLIEANT